VAEDLHGADGCGGEHLVEEKDCDFDQWNSSERVGAGMRTGEIGLLA
jgi:hypothetical protein